jgi:hypothetical protein
VDEGDDYRDPTVGGLRLHFIDAQNMNGHSGSPVFVWPSAFREGTLHIGPRRFLLYGVVSNVLEYSKKQVVVTGELGTPLDYRSGGVTGVVPIRYLGEILDSKKARVAFRVEDVPAVASPSDSASE